jgi:hypothetical protein
MASGDPEGAKRGKAAREPEQRAASYGTLSNGGIRPPLQHRHAWPAGRRHRLLTRAHATRLGRDLDVVGIDDVGMVGGATPECATLGHHFAGNEACGAGNSHAGRVFPLWP